MKNDNSDIERKIYEKIAGGRQMTGHINFAMQQNYIPIFRNLVLTNTTENKIENVKVRILFEPEFARTFETDIPVLILKLSFWLTMSGLEFLLCLR